jgi:hypothetical protein
VIKDIKIQFTEKIVPAIQDGLYSVSASVSVVAKGEKETITAEADFIVASNRFAMGAEDIYSLYPANGAESDFDGHLPMAVFNERMLPWRVLMPDQAPWLALLVFDDQDKIVKKQVTLSDLIKGGAGISAPELTIRSQAGESGADLCTVIEMSKDTFLSIMPDYEELPYLAHVKTADIRNKSENVHEDGCLSAVIASRFPKTSVGGEKNYAHLVSLEGHSKIISRGTPPADKVRLVSLADWSFTSKSGQALNSDIFEVLDAAMLQYNSAAAAPELGRITALGYLPMKHLTFQADKLLSWYRGPAVPVKVAREPVKSANADEFAKYDPDNGMFDVSYAVAWQLGRLLAMENLNLAALIYSWRKKLRLAVKQSKSGKLLSDRLESLGSHGLERDFRFKEKLGSDTENTTSDILRFLAKAVDEFDKR